MKKNKKAFGTGSSIVVKECQVCNYHPLESIIFLGYLPPVNSMPVIGSQPKEEPSYPAELLYCKRCLLVQIGLIVDPKILFPYEYPYTSGTTKVLRDNFSELFAESKTLINLKLDDLVIDVGSNDGTLLGNFKGSCRVLGITPEKIGKLAIKKGIPTIIDYFSYKTTQKIIEDFGKAKIVTAANVFAHIENIHEVLKNILLLLAKNGVFISESHYLFSLLKTVQYDTIYHEHLRYYSLHSLQYLLSMHNLEVFHAKKIPTHGGSIRVYAARTGKYKIRKTVRKILKNEKQTMLKKGVFDTFRKSVIYSKLKLLALIHKIKDKGERIYGISAPSRGTTLINYTGLDDGILDCVLEVKGSYKTGKYIPGTVIPVLEEEKLIKDQPEFVLLFSWHIAKELIPKLYQKGFRGNFIIPLPVPKIVRTND